LLLLFINGMIEEVQTQQLGLSIDHTWMGPLMFVDYMLAFVTVVMTCNT
jgi:hypothetical protein